MAITSLTNQKSGSGKTTVCRTLGETVSSRGRKVLLIDNDPQGNLTRSYFGDTLPSESVRRTASVTGEGEQVSPGVSNTVSCYDRDARPQPYKIHENLYLIGATKALANVAVRPVSGVSEFTEKVTALSRQFDDILIDCPPGASVLQAAAHSASQALLIPTFLNKDNVEGVYQQLDTMNARQQAGHPTLDLLGVVVSAKRTQYIEAYYCGCQSQREDSRSESHAAKHCELCTQ